MNKSVLLAIMVASISLAGVAAHADETTLEKIKRTKSITLGVREASGALSYTTGNGNYLGYHVAICRNVVADLQKTLGLDHLDIKYAPVTSQNRQALVVNGTVDLECGSTTNNANRQKEVAFAVTTYVEEVRIAVNAKSDIQSLAQLDGKKVATTTGTTSVELLRKSKYAQNIKFDTLYGKDHADSFLLLTSGRADAMVMDGSILAGNIATSKNPENYKIVGEVISVEPIALMMRKDDPEFKKAVDTSIITMMKNGTLAKLWDIWFLQPIPPSNNRVGLALSANTKDAWLHPNDNPAESYVKN